MKPKAKPQARKRSGGQEEKPRRSKIASDVAAAGKAAPSLREKMRLRKLATESKGEQLPQSRSGHARARQMATKVQVAKLVRALRLSDELTDDDVRAAHQAIRDALVAEKPVLVPGSAGNKFYPPVPPRFEMFADAATRLAAAAFVRDTTEGTPIRRAMVAVGKFVSLDDLERIATETPSEQAKGRGQAHQLSEEDEG